MRTVPLRVIAAAAGLIFATLDCSRAPRHAPQIVLGPREPTAAAASAMAPGPSPPADTRTEDERNTIQVFRAAAASTVFVTEKQIVVDYFGGHAEEVASGSGTGFVWDVEGHVVTNFHVVKDARSLTVTLHDHRTFEAKVVGAEPRKDVAVLRIDAPREALHPILLPEKGKKMEVGQKTIAIGNPFGLDQTLTTGVVSALGREVQGIGGVSIRDMVQTDAAINPGNSGGPLLDSSGRLMGMNTMIFSRSGSSAGIGFAVPASTIARVVPQIIRTGRAEQIGIGIQVDPAARLEQRAEIPGVVVLQVKPGSPAERAGIRGIQQSLRGITLGDVIVGIAGERVQDYDDLYNTLDKHRAKERVPVTVLREGKQIEVAVELEALP